MWDTSEPSENLSEILFKPRRNTLETSLISNNGCPLPDVEMQHGYNGFERNWYRPIPKLYWAWMGGNVLDIDSALARICCGHGRRTREGLFDTIEDYGPGNWIFEFAAIGQERVMRARECMAAGDAERASHNYRMASRYFAFAAHPNLKGDVLAAEAALLSRQAYRKMFENEQAFAHYEEATFEVSGVKVSVHVHCTDTTRLHPVVILLPTYLQCSTDFYRFFHDYLMPAGIALIIADMPGMGTSSRLRLEVGSSELLTALTGHIREHIPFLDHTSVGVFGMEIGSTLAARFALLNPGALKALCLVNPAIDEFFTNQQGLNALPLCQRSSLANRMDYNAAQWDTMVPQLQALSLKRQGLVSVTSRSQVETLCCVLDPRHQSAPDVRLACSTFGNSRLLEYRKVDWASGFRILFKDAAAFFIEKLAS